jgi:hypothetical protein
VAGNPKVLRDTIGRYLALDLRKLDRLHLRSDKLNVVHIRRGDQEVGWVMVEVLENGNIKLHYTTEERTELIQPIVQPITITSTAGTSGAKQRRFLCSCGRSVAILYCKPHFLYVATASAYRTQVKASELAIAV